MFFISFCHELLDPTSPLYRPGLKRITCKRNPVGHTFCECDSCHGRIALLMRQEGGEVHTAFDIGHANKKIKSWEYFIKKCDYKFHRMHNKDFRDYTKFLKPLYSKPKKATDGSVENCEKWLFSQQHMFELGVWDEEVKLDAPAKQTTMKGFLRSRSNWNDEKLSIVRFWRMSGPKIKTDTIAAYRSTNVVAVNWDEEAGLPVRAYTDNEKWSTISVIKKMHNFLNGRDSGYGDALAGTYPPLTAQEKKKYAIEMKKKKNKGGDEENFEIHDEELIVAADAGGDGATATFEEDQEDDDSGDPMELEDE